jgi:hypothetical protein
MASQTTTDATGPWTLLPRLHFRAIPHRGTSKMLLIVFGSGGIRPPAEQLYSEAVQIGS